MKPLRRITNIALVTVLISFVSTALGASNTAPDTGLEQYAKLLSQAVKPNVQGTASEVDYQWLADHRGKLKSVLESFSAVSKSDFDGWSRDAQLAFLINSYNAYTLELILTEYPDLESIRDIGSIFSTPWKKKFFVLLEKKRSLDNVEHSMIRGQFAEPRIHAAVNCASCGCPALLGSPFQADSLDEQLNVAMAGFLSDNSRNYFDPETNRLWLSPLFDWYVDDFTQTDGSIVKYVEPWSEELGWPADTETPTPRVRFTDYDWQLNDLGHCAG